MLKKTLSKLKNTLNDKKGDIALIGIVITITVTVFIQGYLDTTSANYILDEAQSMIDLTALTTLQSSVDTEGLRYERMTIRPYNYDYEKMHVNQEQNGENVKNHLNNGYLTDGSSIITGNSSGSNTEQVEIANYSIWLDGTNAHHIENYCEAKINERMRKNFDYYMQNFLFKQLAVDGINILNYKVDSFTSTLSYDNWGINRKYHMDTVTFEGPNNTAVRKRTTDYIKMPQTTIDATIQLEIDIDPTFTTAFYSYSLYNAQKTSENKGVQNLLNATAGTNNYEVGDGTYLIDSGFNDDNNLILTIRVVARQTFY